MRLPFRSCPSLRAALTIAAAPVLASALGMAAPDVSGDTATSAAAQAGPGAPHAGLGVSEASPIGTRERLEAALRAAGLAPRPPQEKRSEDMGGLFRVLAWVDEEASARAGASEHVHLLLGLDGSLRGVSGTFSAPGGSEKVSGFLQRYWEEVAGSPPRFEEQAGGSEWMPASQTARLATPGARGTWVKIGVSESVRIRAREG